MVRPLYRDTSPGFDPAKSHAGLWYDKFCDQWMGQWSAPEVKKSDWISTVANGHPVGDDAVLNDFARRQQNLVEATKGKCLALQTESRFVTGLGREHPVENGFAWHPTLGTPYLPGSSIKGLLRAWASLWWANEKEGRERDEQKALIHAILGRGEARADEGAVGAIVIFDALPLQPVVLEADVMTPHYDDYYQKGLAPGDWISPVPIPFLVVAEGTQFQFAFAPRSSAGREYLSTVEAWLNDALRWLGAGAKTAVGYGRFGEPDQSRQRLGGAPSGQQETPTKSKQAAPSLPSPSETVEAILLEEKTRKGGWKAKHIATGISGPIQNSGDVPSDLESGTALPLIVASAKPTEIAFRYPTESEKQRVEKARTKSQSKGQRRRKR